MPGRKLGLEPGRRPRRQLGRRLAALALAVPMAGGVTLGTGSPANAQDDAGYDPGQCAPLASNDPLPKAWQVGRLAPEKAWPIATGTGVRVAVIDTGIDSYQNPVMLRGSRGVVAANYNFTGVARSGDGPPELDCEHGTRVASLIAGQEDPAGRTDFTGIAPDSEIISMRALTATQSEEPEPLEPIVKAIRKAIELEVEVINISQQGSDSPEYSQAVADAIASGIVVVAAAGNLGAENAPPPFPASYPGVIAVGNTDLNDLPHQTSQSNADLEVTVAAPGTDLLMVNPSADGQQSWQTDSGTSFAAPLVSGVVALMLQADPELSPAEVKQRLQNSADPIAAAAPDEQLGYGVVNPHRALTVLPAGSPHPSPEPTVVAPDPRRGKIDVPIQRNAALAVAVLGVAGLALAAAIAAAYPAGRRRGWRSPK